MKYLGTFLIILTLMGCDATQKGFEEAYGVIPWEAQHAYPEESGPFSISVHPCVGMDRAAKAVYETMEKSGSDAEKEAIINILSTYAQKDKSYTVLQSAVEVVYGMKPMPSKDAFIEGVMKGCTHRYGSIMDRNNI